jgi:DNA end-binding protein Ku
MAKKSTTTRSKPKKKRIVRRSKGSARKASSDKASPDAEEGSGGKTHDIWRGVISFGLVEIPVALVPTQKTGGISLSLLDKRDLSPVGYRRYNKSTQEEVPWSEIAHGFEYQKGRFVVVGKKDVQKADPELADTIVIDRFVDFASVAPIQLDRSYYLEALNARSKGYALLRTALENTGKVGVARMVLRTRQYVALVGVHGSALILYLLRFDAEIRKPSALDNADASVRITAAETEMAEKLIGDMTDDWKPSEYVDEYTKSLKAWIQSKVKAGDVHDVETEEAPTKAPREVVDLMPLLKRSLNGRGSSRTAARASTSARKRPTRRATRRKASTRRT